ncbi:MAG: hypothetical protein R3Y70_00995 [Rikenellaceae bacterium]
MSQQNYTLHEVTTSKEEQIWLDFQNTIYEGYENWVRPLDNDIKKVFNRSVNPLFVNGDAIRWVARNSAGEVVGRIAAFYNQEKAENEAQLTGGCGFFDCIDNKEVAHLMFDASREWLKERGMVAMDGPINFGQRDAWWGLLVNGFEYQPLYENPYHPSYYQELFESYGFQNYFNQNTYLFEYRNTNVNSIVRERTDRLNANMPGITFRNIRMNDLDNEAERFRTVYNKAWAKFDGVKELSKEEAIKTFNTIKPIVDPDLIFFGEYQGEVISFFIMVPDLNRIINGFNGKFSLWQKIKLLWALKVSKSCDRIFGVIFAVTPELQGKGVESAMMQATLDQYLLTPKNHYKTLEIAWIGDFNPVMNRMIINYVGAKQHKMHTTYRYLFDRTLPFSRAPRMGFKKE